MGKLKDRFSMQPTYEEVREEIGGYWRNYNKWTTDETKRYKSDLATQRARAGAGGLEAGGSYDQYEKGRTASYNEAMDKLKSGQHGTTLRQYYQENVQGPRIKASKPSKPFEKGQFDGMNKQDVLEMINEQAKTKPEYTKQRTFDEFYTHQFGNRATNEAGKLAKGAFNLSKLMADSQNLPQNVRDDAAERHEYLKENPTDDLYEGAEGVLEGRAEESALARAKAGSQGVKGRKRGGAKGSGKHLDDEKEPLGAGGWWA